MIDSLLIYFFLQVENVKLFCFLVCRTSSGSHPVQNMSIIKESVLKWLLITIEEIDDLCLFFFLDVIFLMTLLNPKLNKYLARDMILLWSLL